MGMERKRLKTEKKIQRKRKGMERAKKGRGKPGLKSSGLIPVGLIVNKVLKKSTYNNSITKRLGNAAKENKANRPYSRQRHKGI